MANLSDPQTIRANYLNLPKPVKEWLSSETAAYLIGEINDRLGLDEEKSAVIPNLVLRLVTQDLDTTNFINEISGKLDVNWQTAKAIAEDIEKKVLRPIENDLIRQTKNCCRNGTTRINADCGATNILIAAGQPPDGMGKIQETGSKN